MKAANGDEVMNQRFEYKTVVIYGHHDLPGRGFDTDPEKQGWRVIKLWRQHDAPGFIIVYERPYHAD